MTELNDYIGSYLRGELDQAAAKVFEERMVREAAFFQQVEEQRALFEALSESEVLDFRAILKGSREDMLKQTTVRKRTAWQYGLAAAVTVLIASMVLFFTLRQTPPQELFAMHFEPYAYLDVVRGSNISEQGWIQFYKSGDFKSTIPLLSKQASQYPDSPLIKLFLANCYLGKNQAADAIPILQNLISENTSSSEEARWYLALALLQEEKKKQARIILEEIVNSPGPAFNKHQAELLLGKW